MSATGGGSAAVQPQLLFPLLSLSLPTCRLYHCLFKSLLSLPLSLAFPPPHWYKLARTSTARVLYIFPVLQPDDSTRERKRRLSENNRARLSFLSPSIALASRGARQARASAADYSGTMALFRGLSDTVHRELPTTL